MFHINEEKRNEIFSETNYTQMASCLYKTYKPLFFTPYKSTAEFHDELSEPLRGPIVFTGLAALGVFAFAIGAAVTVGALLTCGISTLMMQHDWRDECLNLAGKSAALLAIGLCAVVANLALAVLSLPYSLLSLVTRSLIAPFLSKADIELKNPVSDDYNPSLSSTI